MKKSLLILSVMLCALFVSSCATFSNISATSPAVVSEANFHKVRSISREFPTTYVFGIFGGAERRAALERAIADMTDELGPNQALAYLNIVDSRQVPVIPIVVKVSTKVSAVIIEYDR